MVAYDSGSKQFVGSIDLSRDLYVHYLHISGARRRFTMFLKGELFGHNRSGKNDVSAYALNDARLDLWIVRCDTKERREETLRSI